MVNDVVMSIEYSLSGNSNSEAGFSFFITTSANISGGGGGVGLGYTGDVLAADGVASAIAGFGIDTHGYFGLSGTDIDGVAPVANSVGARGGYAEFFSMSALGNYYELLPANIPVVLGDDRLRSLRYRVGNLGRTMYLDYRENHDDEYINIAEVELGDRINLLSSYRVGIGYASPFSSIEEAVPNLVIRSIHIEGLEAV